MAPSGLRPIYWTHSLSDLETVVRIKFGYEAAKISQDFENLAEVVSAALGGKKDGRVSKPKNLSEAKQAFAEIFGARSVG